MTDLIMRAEQGVLGALLSARDAGEQTLIFDTVGVDDFGHPAHQAVYNAIVDLRFSGYTDQRLISAVAAIADHTDIDAGWLTALAASAPSEAHVRAYMKIVLAASFDRATEDFAEPYLLAAELETDLEARASFLRTAHTLQIQAKVFGTSSLIEPEASVVVATMVVERDLTREERVIADLLQHPEQARHVAAWLTSDVFTTEQRRLAYEITVSHAYFGDPVDPVIVAWDVERAREINTYDRQQPVPSDPRPELDYPYLARLATTAVVTGTAITVGHQLLSEHTAATLALSATAAAERQAAAQAVAQPPLEAQLGVNPVIDRRIEL
jgi:replicative DNA helicase